jgi:hypothetical protein
MSRETNLITTKTQYNAETIAEMRCYNSIKEE